MASSHSSLPQDIIIDSHIHLFTKSHVSELAWQTQNGPLASQYSVEEYRSAVHDAPFSSQSMFKGFVFVETDRKSTIFEENSGWDGPIEELEFVGRVATGHPINSEGHEPEDKRLCKAIVGWAPLPAGRRAMERYEHRVRQAIGDEAMAKIVGWRYLVQDKPPGTMLRDSFTDSLKWIGERGYSFDLGVDFRCGGSWQLKEAAEMILCVNRNVIPESRPVIIINHMAKPDLRENSSDAFQDWKEHIAALAAFPNTYMKISGAMSELPPLPMQTDQEALVFWDRQAMLLESASHTAGCVQFIIETFSPSRCMFGSDWPICNIGGGGTIAFKNWIIIVRTLIASLDPNSRAHIWGLTAAKVYKISD